MEFTVTRGIAEPISREIIIAETGDALDMLATCSYLGADAAILYEENLTPDFFELRTRLAGDILQKFSQYGFRVAIVGDFGKYESKSLRDFIRESNRMGHILFVATAEDARERLSEKIG